MLWPCLNILHAATCVTFCLPLFLHTSTTFVHLYYCHVSIPCPSGVYWLLILYSFTMTEVVNGTENFTAIDTDNLEVEELLSEEPDPMDVSSLPLEYILLSHCFPRYVLNTYAKSVMKQVYINTR